MKVQKLPPPKKNIFSIEHHMVNMRDIGIPEPSKCRFVLESVLNERKTTKTGLGNDLLTCWENHHQLPWQKHTQRHVK